MKVNDILTIIKKGNHVMLFTEEFKTTVFDGLCDHLNHCLIKENISKYLDRRVLGLSILDDALVIYCE